MNFLKRVNNAFEIKGTQNTQGVTVRQSLLPALADPIPYGNEAVLHPHKNGENIIAQGYNMNATVNACMRRLTGLFGKIPFYVVQIKKGEQKTYSEYQWLIKSLHDKQAVQEARKMQKKSIDGIILDNTLAKFLDKPNRVQSGIEFRKHLLGYKKLTGEGNIWFNRGPKDVVTGRVLEMFTIPKFALQLIGNSQDPWEIVDYQVTIPGREQERIKKNNILMWKEQGYQFDGNFLNHLRGQSPLEAVLLQIQALNEGQIRQIKEAVSGGANGLLYRKDAKDLPNDPKKLSDIRYQINNAVNGNDLAGTVAWLAGEWDYINFAKTSQELQRVELSQKNADDICNVLGVPPGLLKSDQTYTNAPAYYRELIYGAVAPEAYSLRDTWNNTLVESFGLDRERYAIDCDVLALPELAEDLASLINAVKGASFLDENEKRIACNYEPKPGLDIHLYPSGSETVENLTADISLPQIEEE